MTLNEWPKAVRRRAIEEQRDAAAVPSRGRGMGARDIISCAHQARPGAGGHREGGHADALVSAAGRGLHPLPAALVKERDRAGDKRRPPFPI